jgi:hypothetical protein
VRKEILAGERFACSARATCASNILFLPAAVFVYVSVLLIVPTNGQSTQDPDLTKALIAQANAETEYYRQQTTGVGRHDGATWAVPLVSGVLAIFGTISGVLVTSMLAQWKANKEQQQVYARQKKQLRWSALDLRGTLANLSKAEPFPPAFLDEQLIYSQPPRPTSGSRSDPYYLKYDLVNTVYRLCAFLGWMELYRRDPSFLSGPFRERVKIEIGFDQIRRALAGSLTSGTARLAYGFILEDDQRAIGEQMFGRRREATSVIGYAQFCERLFRTPSPEDPIKPDNARSQNYWIWNATRFLIELGKYSDPDVARLWIEHVRDALSRLDDVLENIAE